MIGRRFGQLLVIERVPKIDRYARFRCRCDCGALTEVRGTHLRSGHSRSCGCGRRAFTETGAQMAVPMIGKRFGMLTVIARAGSTSFAPTRARDVAVRVPCGNTEDAGGADRAEGPRDPCGRRDEIGKAKLVAWRRLIAISEHVGETAQGGASREGKAK